MASPSEYDHVPGGDICNSPDFASLLAALEEGGPFHQNPRTPGDPYQDVSLQTPCVSLLSTAVEPISGHNPQLPPISHHGTASTHDAGEDACSRFEPPDGRSESPASSPPSSATSCAPPSPFGLHSLYSTISNDNEVSTVSSWHSSVDRPFSSSGSGSDEDDNSSSDEGPEASSPPRFLDIEFGRGSRRSDPPYIFEKDAGYKAYYYERDSPEPRPPCVEDIECFYEPPAPYQSHIYAAQNAVREALRASPDSYWFRFDQHHGTQAAGGESPNSCTEMVDTPPPNPPVESPTPEPLESMVFSPISPASVHSVSAPLSACSG